MNQKKAIESITKEAKKNKEIIALGIGGSFARKENDFFSDIDIYIVTSEKYTIKRGKIISELSSNLPRILQYNEVGLHQGFGYLFQVTYQPCLIVDYNFNTLKSLESHPTWRNRVVLYDNSQKFEKFIQNEKNKWTNDELYKYHHNLLPKLTMIFWQESYLKAYKAIARGNILLAIRYQHRMKEILFYLIRLHHSLFPIVPDNPLRNIELDFINHPEIIKITQQTQPQYSSESIIESIKKTIYYFEKYSHSIKKSEIIRNILKQYPINILSSGF